MRLVAHFPQQMLRNALYQYTICTVPQNKFPANAKFAEFRNNNNLRMETLINSNEGLYCYPEYWNVSTPTFSSTTWIIGIVGILT